MSQSAAPLEVLVLAAGQGKRMVSRRPKVLHMLAGRPLLRHVLDAVAEVDPARVHVVVGHLGEMVRAEIEDDVVWVDQHDRRGTGHAVMQALPGVADGALVLVVYGDVPLIRAETLRACVAAAHGGGVGLVTARPQDPAQLGRILRNDSGAIHGIVEFADADSRQRAISEINSGILAAPRNLLGTLLDRVTSDNVQGELYLTDVIALAVEDGVEVTGVTVDDPVEVGGINDRAELAAMERHGQRRAVADLMRQGVSVADPERLDLRGEVLAGQDCYIDINVILEGPVRIGNDVYIGPGAVIRDSVLGDGVRIEAHTVIDGAEVGADCTLGPFARLRPGTRLGREVKIGNFVEAKKSVIGDGSKANHLAYLGDTTLGVNCNVGAGTITCNYDGFAKHPTEVGDRVFVGSNATLVAPLVIESDAYVAAGSTVTTKVSQQELAVGRGRQRNISGWVRPDQRKPKSSTE